MEDGERSKGSWADFKFFRVDSKDPGKGGNRRYYVKHNRYNIKYQMAIVILTVKLKISKEIDIS